MAVLNVIGATVSSSILLLKDGVEVVGSDTALLVQEGVRRLMLLKPSKG